MNKLSTNQALARKLEPRRMDSTDPEFKQHLEELLAFDSVADERILQVVRTIIQDVRKRGDLAVLDCTKKFDNLGVETVAQLKIPIQRMQQAAERIRPQQLDALQQAAERIRAFHEKQIQKSWQYQEPDGTMLGQQITALDSVGIYVPGGKAAYPSTVLMNAIPAKVAGVKRILMMVPDRLVKLTSWYWLLRLSPVSNKYIPSAVRRLSRPWRMVRKALEKSIKLLGPVISMSQRPNPWYSGRSVST